MAVYVSKSDIEALEKDLQKISTDNDNVKKNIDSAIKDIEKQSYDAKDDQVAKLKDIKKKLDQQVSTANEMVKIFQDTQNGFFTIDNNFKKKAAEIVGIAGGAGIAGISVNENPSVTTKDEKIPEKDSKEPSNTDASMSEPSYITNPNAERDKIVNDILNGRRVGLNGGEGSSISCNWITNVKLAERGKVTITENGNQITGGLQNAEIGNDEYLAWKSSHTGYNTMANSTEAYLGELVDKKDGPLYNVYVTSGNNNHTVLLDKVYKDEKGQLRYVVSENWDLKSKETMVAPNNSHTKGGAPVNCKALGTQKDVKASSKSIDWEGKPAATQIYVFGE